MTQSMLLGVLFNEIGLASVVRPRDGVCDSDHMLWSPYGGQTTGAFPSDLGLEGLMHRSHTRQRDSSGALQSVSLYGVWKLNGLCDVLYIYLHNVYYFNFRAVACLNILRWGLKCLSLIVDHQVFWICIRICFDRLKSSSAQKLKWNLSTTQLYWPVSNTYLKHNLSV